MTSLNEKPDSHRSPEVLPPRRRPLQTQYPAVRARAFDRTARTAIFVSRPWTAPALNAFWNTKKVILATGIMMF
jgi:hypothetical protein